MENNDPDYCYYSGLPSPAAYSVPSSKESGFSAVDIDRIIEMAWEDRTPFEAIEFQFGLNEAGVKALMKQQLKPSSYKRWRKRVHSRTNRHQAKRSEAISRFKSNMQRTITHNKISKRS